MVVNSRTYIVHAADAEQEDVLEAFLRALKIKFEATGVRTYNKDFVSMVLQADDSIKKGKGRKVTSQEFDNLWK